MKRITSMTAIIAFFASSLLAQTQVGSAGQGFDFYGIDDFVRHPKTPSSNFFKGH